MAAHRFHQVLLPKVHTLLWFARRPAMYREAVRRITGFRLTTPASVERAANEKLEGQRWCSANVASVEEFLRHMTLPELSKVADEHGSVFARAETDVAHLDMGGPGHVDLLYNLARSSKVARVLETGVAAGWSSLAILLALHEKAGARLVSIDMPYPKRNNEHQVGAAVPVQLRSSWTLIRRPDRDALWSALQSLGEIDLAHYDSDKSPQGRDFAYPLLWEHLRPGGVLLSDDVEDNLSFRNFAERVNRRAWVFRKWEGNYAGALVK